MEHYKVTLSEQERAQLQDIAGKGTHAAAKVINALILLNCDQAGGRTERPRTCDIPDAVQEVKALGLGQHLRLRLAEALRKVCPRHYRKVAPRVKTNLTSV